MLISFPVEDFWWRWIKEDKYARSIIFFWSYCMLFYWVCQYALLMEHGRGVVELWYPCMCLVSMLLFALLHKSGRDLIGHNIIPKADVSRWHVWTIAEADFCWPRPCFPVSPHCNCSKLPTIMLFHCRALWVMIMAACLMLFRGVQSLYSHLYAFPSATVSWWKWIEAGSPTDV